MFCPYCGNELIDDAEFCMSCGKKIPDVSATADDAGSNTQISESGDVATDNTTGLDMEHGESEKLPTTQDGSSKLPVTQDNAEKLPTSQDDSSKLPVAWDDSEKHPAPYDDSEKLPAIYEPKKKLPKKKLIIAAAIAVFVIAACILTAVLIKKGGKDDSKNAKWTVKPKGKHIAASELPYAPQLDAVLSKLYNISFNYSSSGNQDDGSAFGGNDIINDPRLYDSREVAENGSDILENILKTYSIADYSLYPVDSPKFFNTKNGDPMDPWGKAAAFGMYSEYYEETAGWIATNIFNADEKDIAELREKANKSTGSVSGYYFANDKYYYYHASAPSKVRSIYGVSIGDVMSDGRYYYINYRVDMGETGDDGPHTKPSSNCIDGYAIMELKDIKGEKYWSVLYHSGEIPGKLSSATYTEMKDIIAENCVKYTEDSGIAKKKSPSYTVTEEWREDIGSYWLVQIYEGSSDGNGKSIAYYYVNKDCTVYDWWDISDDPKNIPIYISE